MVALEQESGWTRTLMMTRLRPTGCVATKVIVALSMGALPMLVLAVCGPDNPAPTPRPVWIACLALGWLRFSRVRGVRADGRRAVPVRRAMRVMGGGIALLAFAGNVFVPLQGTMLTISQFTPDVRCRQHRPLPARSRHRRHDEHIS